MTTVQSSPADADYEAEILSWRQEKDNNLRDVDGWLALTGLYWLHEGVNTIGSDPVADVLLPLSGPAHLGTITLQDGITVLTIAADTEVTIDRVPIRSAVLRNDYDPQGKTRVTVDSVRFHVIKRADKYGVRINDQNNPARQTFTGRRWFPIQPEYRLTGQYIPYTEPRQLTTETVVGIDVPIENPGYAVFSLHGQTLRFEAFSGEDGAIWFVFRETSDRTYRPGRFLYAAPQEDGSVLIDFNRAYNPPCAFTPYATCPLPPRQNILTFAIEAGESAPE
ncbi:MAG: DUF1684 domain-containing protein [Anaerolineae bacterium]